MTQYGYESTDKVESAEEEIHPLAHHRKGSTVLTCAVCGCRLTPRQSLADGGEQGPDVAWRHYDGLPGRDARGCRVDCVDLPHRITPDEEPTPS